MLDVLPEVVIRDLVQFLSVEDRTSLSCTSRSLGHVRPKFWEIKGEDFSKDGPYGGHWWPELYFDGPTLMTRVKSLRINMSWGDQGWGNRKGKIWLQLMRNGRMVTESMDIFGVAPHYEEEVVADLIDDTVVKMARPGDMFR